jgi:hypothetical protein
MAAKKTNYIQNRRNSARLKEKSEGNKRHLASIDRVADALETTKIQEQTDNYKRAFREKLTISLLVATVGDVPRNVEKGGAALLALSLLGSGC